MIETMEWWLSKHHYEEKPKINMGPSNKQLVEILSYCRQLVLNSNEHMFNKEYGYHGHKNRVSYCS